MTSNNLPLVCVGLMELGVPGAFKSHRFATAARKLNFQPEEIWEAISAPGNLLDCHPFCRSNEPIEWDDMGHSDVIVYLNGRTYVRQFRQWSPKNGYDLTIGEEGGKQSYVRWEIAPINDEQSELRITVYPYLLSNLPRIAASVPFALYVRPKLTAYLDSVIRGFEYYLETGERVPRNHFGKHSWFSD